MKTLQLTVNKSVPESVSLTLPAYFKNSICVIRVLSEKHIESISEKSFLHPAPLLEQCSLSYALGQEEATEENWINAIQVLKEYVNRLETSTKTVEM